VHGERRARSLENESDFGGERLITVARSRPSFHNHRVERRILAGVNANPSYTTQNVAGIEPQRNLCRPQSLKFINHENVRLDTAAEPGARERKHNSDEGEVSQLLLELGLDLCVNLTKELGHGALALSAINFPAGFGCEAVSDVGLESFG
jgi:hypothetical protein